MNKHILFKHPDLKIRKEHFGGIIKTTEGLFLIDKKAYMMLDKVNNKKAYPELAKDNESKKIIDKLLKLRIILKIEMEKAEKIKKQKVKKINRMR